MGQARGAGQDLAELHAGKARADGAEFTAHGGGPVGLGIERFLLGMSAVQEEGNDLFRAAERRPGGECGPRAAREQ